MKFSHKIVTCACLILFVALSILSIYQFQQVRSEISKQIDSGVSEVEEALNISISNVISAKTDFTQYLAQALNGDFSENNLQKLLSIDTVLNEFVVVGVGLENGFYWDNDVTFEPGDDFDPRTRVWYQQAKQQNKTIYTAPYEDAYTGDMLVSIAVPIQADGQFAGVFFTDINLAELAKVTNQVDIFKVGYAFITEQNGQIIAHPDPNNNGENINSVYNTNFNLYQQQNNFEYQGSNTTLYLSPILDLGWQLGVMLDQDEVYQPIDAIKVRLLIFACIMLAMAMIVMLLLLNKLMSPIRQINDAMQEIASGEGDLTHRLDSNFEPEFKQLAVNFNLFASKVQQLIIDVQSQGKQLRDNARETSDGSTLALRAIDKQNAEIDQLATAMQEMTVTAADVAANAQDAAQAVNDADHEVDKGVNNVEQTTTAINLLAQQLNQSGDAVNQLAKDTQSISSILQTINDIAAQTNLLALNAAIEAARAGDMGKGFAVVAAEVRNLANSTHTSIHEIEQKIAQLQAGVEDVVQVMDQSLETTQTTVDMATESHDSLAVIRSKIANIMDMNLQIASAAEQQSQVAEEINRHTVNISDVAQDVAHNAQDASSAMQQQLQLTHEQEKTLNSFKV